MAPQYAPSLRSRLAPLLLILQTGFIIIAALCFENKETNKPDRKSFFHFYPEFQDVNVMMILGFGFLCTFPVRYGFSGSGFNLLVAIIATQWALILNGLDSWYNTKIIRIDLKSIVKAELCAVSALISIGSVLGKTNPVQLTLIALLEVTGFALNEWLLQTLLKVQPPNSIMLLHVFGALFGLMLTWILYRDGSKQGFEKETFDKKSGLFSMLGAVFLWMFWPSFNSVLVGDDQTRLEAVCSTYLSLAVSAVTAAALAVLSSPRGKFNPIQMQSCILAGGAAVGVSVSVVQQPWEAMALGFTAAILSTLGYRYLKTHLLIAFECHDTCSVLSTHGLPGLLGWLAQLVLQIKYCDDHTVAVRFAVFHICTLFITVSLSLSMGIITAFLVKWTFWRPQQNKKCFDDQAFWEVFTHKSQRKKKKTETIKLLQRITLISIL
ncbi:ammonium transporter Rh type A-like isoform X1 [Xiphophorus maculatus]|uniref:ammonium transporter Rh type A-like isoform X1 n=1 Tax=Xiphophorus maculatus TaxID=8083 RepID=UPI000C6CFEC6|nr:ammonium transporter Rh type A-like isoform X1 [Xiphophorus maculatus]